MRLLLIFTSCSLFILGKLTAQTSNEIDSLTNQLKFAKEDTNKVNLLNELCYKYSFIDSKKALKFGEESLILSKKLKFKKGESNASRFVGFAFFNAGDNHKALSMHLQALRCAEDINDIFLIGRAMNAIGGVYSLEGENRKSVDYFLEAIKYAETSNDNRLKLAATVSLGSSYIPINKDSALYYSTVGLQIAKEQGVKNSEAAVMNNLGEVHRQLGNEGISREYFKLAINIIKQTGIETYMISALIGLSKSYQNLHADSALLFAHQAYVLAKKGNFLPQESEVLTFFTQFYTKQKNKDSAFYYQSKMISVNDSLFNRDKFNRFQNLSFDESMRQKEIALQEIQEKEAKKIQIQYAFVAISILVFIVVFILISNSILVNEKWIHFLGVLTLLLVFEFINLLFHSFIAGITNHSPILMLLTMVVIASMLIPLHHKIEKYVSKKMIAKNRKLRLKAAQNIIRAHNETDESLTEN